MMSYPKSYVTSYLMHYKTSSPKYSVLPVTVSGVGADKPLYLKKGNQCLLNEFGIYVLDGFSMNSISLAAALGLPRDPFLSKILIIGPSSSPIISLSRKALSVFAIYNRIPSDNSNCFFFVRSGLLEWNQMLSLVLMETAGFEFL